VPRTNSIKLDLASAYLASAVKIGIWAAVSAIVFWYSFEAGLGILSLVRSTIGILNYTTLGLGPAMVHLLAKQSQVVASAPPLETTPERVLNYASPTRDTRLLTGTPDDVFKTGQRLSAFFAVIGILVMIVIARYFRGLFVIPTGMLGNNVEPLVFCTGLGLVFRLLSDAFGARLQVEGSIWIDNVILICGDVLFVVLVILFSRDKDWLLAHVGLAFLLSSTALLIARVFAGTLFTYIDPRLGRFNSSIASFLITFGTILTLANVADFLYAPTDFILINNLINPATAGIYSPAVQIDAALLLLVTGLASVIFPRAAVAHAGGNLQTLRTYYVRGTIASLGLLLLAGGVVYFASPFIFQLWLRNPMTTTQAILPLVLVHTIVGGSSGVGRSILLAMGKVKPFTVAVLCAGALNVILSFTFVKYLHLGLPGIILGTIIAVVARCAIWMPWYTLRALRRGEVNPQNAVDGVVPPELI